GCAQATFGGRHPIAGAADEGTRQGGKRSRDTADRRTPCLTDWRRPMTAKAALVFRQPDIKVFDRGNGVQTRLFCNETRCGAQVTTGMTTLPAGSSVALHYHNCDEQIVILSG